MTLDRVRAVRACLLPGMWISKWEPVKLSSAEEPDGSEAVEIVVCGWNDQTKKALKDKNAPMISLLCEKNGISSDKTKKLIDFSRFSLPIRDAVLELRTLGFGDNAKSAEALDMLELIANTLTESEAACVSLDFSVIHGMNYYDGTVFAGYIDGVAEAVLKGGEYGKLIEKMGHEGSGLGFALYTDLLERLDDGEISYAADVMLVCGDASPEAIAAEVKKIRDAGKTVLVQKGRVCAERCAEVIVLGGEV